LNLSPGGSISGTPTTLGTYTFTISATDANLFTGQRAYTQSVNILESLFLPLVIH
jgi:hypothetical protein